MERTSQQEAQKFGHLNESQDSIKCSSILARLLTRTLVKG